MNDHEPDGTAEPATDADAISRPSAGGDVCRDASSWSSPLLLGAITVPDSDTDPGSGRFVRGW